MDEKELELFREDGCLTDEGLQALRDGQLDELGRLEAAEHLSYCDKCMDRYTALLDVDDWMQKHYYDYTLSKLIAPDYPPVFLWYGKSDRILKLFGFDQQGPALQSALEIDGVPHEEKVYEDVGHGIGIGLGTDAEGWLNAAVAFWKKVT